MHTRCTSWNCFFTFSKKLLNITAENRNPKSTKFYAKFLFVFLLFCVFVINEFSHGFEGYTKDYENTDMSWR
jgi:hypothetical protein